LLISVEEDVFSLDVAVYYIAFVQTFDGFGNGAEELFGLLLF
jgi:hypothetical protein